MGDAMKRILLALSLIVCGPANAACITGTSSVNVWWTSNANHTYQIQVQPSGLVFDVPSTSTCDAPNPPTGTCKKLGCHALPYGSTVRVHAIRISDGTVGNYAAPSSAIYCTGGTPGSGGSAANGDSFLPYSGGDLNGDGSVTSADYSMKFLPPFNCAATSDVSGGYIQLPTPVNP